MKLGFPVLLHGVSDDPTRVTSEAVLAALDIAPVTSAQQAQAKLDAGELAFITIDDLCAPMAKQLALRWRMGVRNSAHTLAAGDAVCRTRRAAAGERIASGICAARG